MTLVPVICESASCRKTWWTDRLFHIESSAAIVSTNTRVGPCPFCGGIGRVPDGEYRATSATLFRPDDLHALLAAARELQRRYSEGEALNSVVRDLSDDDALRGLARFLPQTSMDLATWLLVLLAALTYLGASGPSEVHLPSDVEEAIREVADELRTNRRSSPQKPRPKVPAKSERD